MSNLTLKNISHFYGDSQILDDININVKPGEITCLLGGSGCGKSTMLRIAAGVEAPKEGSILIANKNVTNIPTEKRGVGLVFQNPSLFPHLKVIDNVAFGINKNKSSSKKNIALKFLKKVRMEKYANSYPATLSGGQQQRVAIARALAHEPKVMLLDEPFANLDALLRRQIGYDALGLLKSTKIATLMVTHDPEEAFRMADNIYIMQNGTIIQEGEPEKIYNHPANKFVAEFFGEVNPIKITKSSKNKIQKQLKELFLQGQPQKINDNSNISEILIRPEDIILSEEKSNNSIKSIIRDVRFLGQASLVNINLIDSDINLRCKVSGKTTFAKNDVAYCKINKLITLSKP